MKSVFFTLVCALGIVACATSAQTKETVAVLQCTAYTFEHRLVDNHLQLVANCVENKQ